MEVAIQADTGRFEQVARRVAPGSRLVRAWHLTGGVSARVTALEIEGADGRVRKVVARLHGETDRRRNPHIAADEYQLLRSVRSAGVPVPAPLYVDLSGEIFPTPYVVVEFVEGSTDVEHAGKSEVIRDLARQLASIHAVEWSAQSLAFLPGVEERMAAKLGSGTGGARRPAGEERIRDTLQAAWPLPRRNQPALLHGDFWPGNVLWRDGQIAAVLDWEDAMIGDPLADLGNTRLEMLWAFGREAMEAFTDQYRAFAAVDFTDLPYWDLFAALGQSSKLSTWGLDEATEQRMQDELGWFVAQALEALDG